MKASRSSKPKQAQEVWDAMEKYFG